MPRYKRADCLTLPTFPDLDTKLESIIAQLGWLSLWCLRMSKQKPRPVTWCSVLRACYHCMVRKKPSVRQCTHISQILQKHPQSPLSFTGNIAYELILFEYLVNFRWNWKLTSLHQCIIHPPLDSLNLNKQIVWAVHRCLRHLKKKKVGFAQ